MLDAASDAQDAVSLSRRPHLPPTDLEVADKDEDVVAAAAAPPLVLLPDVDPPSGQSRQEGHQGTWDLRPPVEDIMCPHPRHSMSRPPRTRTSRNFFATWNACYFCGFDVVDGHTSQTCPQHLKKPYHNIYFTRQNAQQYIDQEYNCATKYRHITVLPQM